MRVWVAASLCSSAHGQRDSSSAGKTSYPAHDPCAALALAHHVSRAVPNLPAGHVPRGLETARPLAEPRLQLRVGIVVFEAAVQRVPNELMAVLEEVGTKLSACAREVMQRVQVKLAGKLSDDTVRSLWSAYHRGAELVLAVGSGSRITAEGCRESIDVRIWPLVCCFRMFVRCRRQQVAQQRLHIRDAGR